MPERMIHCSNQLSRLKSIVPSVPLWGRRKRLGEEASLISPNCPDWERFRCFDLMLTNEFISATVSPAGIFCTRDRSAFWA